MQVIPHVTDEIKARIRKLESETPADVILAEVGGTTGDIEGLPFLEAIRQFIHEAGPQNAIVMHVTLVPFIKAAGELKTKPSQQSIAKLREIGLHPDVLICRTEHPIEPDVRQKLSLFCNVPLHAVVEARDVDHTVYELPLMLQQEKLDETVCKLLALQTPPPDTSDWQAFVKRVISPKKRMKIAVVGKYIELQDAYKSIYESLTHAGAANDCGIEAIRVDAQDIETDGAEKHLRDVAGVVVPGGFGDRGVEGKIMAAQYAREHKVPYLGLCLGMQVATIEFARNVCGLANADSTEFDPKTPHPVICMLEEQLDVTQKGASMRLGTWPTKIVEGTLAHRVYGKTEIFERHRHRYEFNDAYKQQLTEKGFVISGTSPDGTLAELIEIPGHPWFLACQFHPEFKSKPRTPHPLFKGFVEACLSVKV